jgi:hypothetical protein
MGASILFSILFGLTLLAHCGQAVHYHAWYTWVLIMSAIWQTAAFIIRCIGNAFCFMVMARLVHMFMPEHRIFRLKGSWLAVIFVFLDIL